MTDPTPTPTILELKSAVDAEMQRVLKKHLLPGYPQLLEMLSYHLGWDQPSPGDGSGKRLRPIFLLLSCQAAGGDWRVALPAAAGVELLHNFTLIHDDIQDRSPLRHGRPSVWKKWNTALAINAGDTMFSLANLAMLGLAPTLKTELVLEAQRILLETCVQLTHGQHLDISNESKNEISIEEYLEMIEGKTAVLIGASMRIGVTIAGGEHLTQEGVFNFGKLIGLAFQVVDDILGIWGQTEIIGKSSDSDLMSRKLSLPILYGIRQEKEFARRWRRGSFKVEEIPLLADLLQKEGARDYTEGLARRLTAEAMRNYDQIGFKNEAGRQLRDKCEELVTRNY